MDALDKNHENESNQEKSLISIIGYIENYSEKRIQRRFTDILNPIRHIYQTDFS